MMDDSEPKGHDSFNNTPTGQGCESHDLALMRNDLLTYALARVSDPDLAEELVQEAYVKFLNIEDKAGIENPKGYIIRIIFNLSVSYYRKKRIRPVDTDDPVDLDQHPGTEPTPEELAHYRQLQAKFENAYSALSLRHREIFYLRRMEGLTTDEIANRFGVSQRMIQKHLAQIIKHIHKRLGDI